VQQTHYDGDCVDDDDDCRWTQSDTAAADIDSRVTVVDILS